MYEPQAVLPHREDHSDRSRGEPERPVVLAQGAAVDQDQHRYEQDHRAGDRRRLLDRREVERIDAATDRARDLGASVLLGPREGPAGWRSVVWTPAGGEIALWQQKR